MKRLVSLAMIISAIGCAPGDQPAGSDTEAVQQKLVLPEARSFAFADPGGAYFSGLPFIAFTGTDRRVNVSHRDFLGNWLNPVTINERALGGASVIEFRGLRLVFINEFGDFTSYRSTDGVTWTDRRTIQTHFSDSGPIAEPGLVVGPEGSLHAYVAVQPFNPTTENWRNLGRIREFVMAPGLDWSDAGFFQAAPFGGPSAAVLSGRIVVAWKGSNNFFTRSKSSGSWGPLVTILKDQDGALFAPAGVTGSPFLIWAYRENGGVERNRLKFSRTFDTQTFSDWKVTNHTSERRPFIIGASQGGVIEWTHNGMDGINGVNYNTVGF
jgi:hypothetical protein